MMRTEMTHEIKVSRGDNENGEDDKNKSIFLLISCPARGTKEQDGDQKRSKRITGYSDLFEIQ